MNKWAKRVLFFISLLTISHGAFCGIKYSSTTTDALDATNVVPLISPTTGSITLSAWVVNTLNTSNQQFAICVNGASGQEYINIGFNTRSSGIGTLNAFYRDTGAHSISINSVSTYNDGNQHHVCCVYDNPTKNLSLYIDGVFIASGTNASMGNISVTHVTIGGQRPSNGAITTGFTGIIDDPRIYMRAISLNEVRSLASGIRILDTDKLIGWWPGDEGVINTFVLGNVLDRSGNNSTAIKSGSPKWIQSNFLTYP